MCVSAFVIELDRARSGNTLSWAYVFEWPILGAYAIYMWRKLLRSDVDEARPLPTPSQDERDALASYNLYLDEAHRHDATPPTGG